ncbi:MAG: TonB-dependent siderophore receptor [Proteobacteria bacterium]|nr:TonB-dependent siderophore receptor [Pseudomonadota bacterium]
MPYFQRRPLAALILTLFSASQQSLAQAGSEQVLPEVKVRGVAETADGPVQGYRATRSGTATKTDTPLNEVPASVSVIPVQLMQDTAMQGLGDAFRYVPGVLMHQGEGNRDQVVIRGNSTTADFYVNGVRDDAQVFRDLYNLERAEFLKGPAGMIFGRGGAGGVVNLVTKKPVFDRVLGGTATLGSRNQLRGTLDVGNRWGDSAAFRLNAMVEGADSFRAGADLKRYAINPAVTLVPGGSTALTFSYERLHDDRTADRGFPSRSGAPFNADPATFFGNAAQSNSVQTTDRFSAVLEHTLGNGWQLKNTLQVAHYDKFYQNVYPGSAVNAAGTLTLSAYNNQNTRTNVFNQTDFTKKLELGGMEHTILAGVEIGHQDSTNKRNTGFFGAATGVVVPASNPFATATRFAPNGTDADNNVTANVGAVYLQDQVALSRNWKAVAGVRYDRFSVNFDDRRVLVPATDLARTDTGTSPRVGLIWTPTSSSSYYASYSYAMLPSGEQLGLATTTSDLAPEKAKNYELGARWDLRPGLTLSAALFRTDRADVRVADPVNIGFFAKSGLQRTEGLEVGLVGQVTKNWEVYAAYTNQDGRVKNPISTGTTAAVATITPAGNKIGLVPDQVLSVWNKVGLGAGWSAGLGVIHQSSSFTSFNNTVTLPAFTRLDGAVYYAFDTKTRLALNIENMADRKYFPTVDGDNNISPGAPRTWRLTLAKSL